MLPQMLPVLLPSGGCPDSRGEFTPAPRQQFLYFVPEPHGQGGHESFRPTLGAVRGALMRGDSTRNPP